MSGDFLKKESCPACGSKDNLARYTDGHAYCFGCHYREKGASTFKVDPSDIPKTDFKLLEGTVMPLKARGITQETCQLYGYTTGNTATGKCHIAPIRDQYGTVVAQKLRFQNKEFRVKGKIPEDALFGKHLVKGNLRLVITEGEIDAMSVSQAQGNKYPAISIPNGAKSAKKHLVANLDWLRSFGEVILFFDNDEAGQDAVKECAEALVGVNVKVAKLQNFKDPNDAVKAKQGHLIVEAIYRATAFRPDGLISFADIVKGIGKPIEMGLPWFNDSLTALTYGRRYGEFIVLGAGTGVGKTDLITQSIAYDVHVLKQKVGVFFLEQDKVETGKRICGKIDGKLYHVPNAQWDETDLIKTANDLAKDDLVTFYDSFGISDWDAIESKIVYLANQGTKIFYVDHLTALATSQDEEERIALEKITAAMASIAKRFGLILIVISHLTTPEKGPSHEEGGRVTIRQFKGSRAIGFWAYYMFGLERNQQAEDENMRHVTTFRILKDRYTGQATGRTIAFKYDALTGLSEEVTEALDEDGYGFQAEGDSF